MEILKMAQEQAQAMQEVEMRLDDKVQLALQEMQKLKERMAQERGKLRIASQRGS